MTAVANSVADQPIGDDDLVDELGARLIEAAAEVFAQKGYDGAGVQEIARRAGVTTGAIYSRYRGKADLLVDAVRVHCTGPLDDLLLRDPDVDAERLAAAGTHLGVRGVGLGQALLLEAMVAARRDEELRAVLAQRMTERRTQLATAIGSAQRNGSIDPAIDLAAVVQLTHAIALGHLLQDAVGLPGPTPEAWSDLIARLIDGLAATGDQEGH